MIEKAFYTRDLISGDVRGICVVYEDGRIIGIPLDTDNTDYQKIMKLVAEGKLVIAPADA